MASTRDINSRENYILEQRSHSQTRNNLLYKHAPNGQAALTMFPGDGIAATGRIANRELSANYTDIENLLFGISANNLVDPLPTIEPQINQLPSLDIIQKPATIQIAFQKPLQDQRIRLMASSATTIPSRWDRI